MASAQIIGQSCKATEISSLIPLRYTKLIVSGCSLSAGSSDLSHARVAPDTWSHFLLQQWPIDVYANLAIVGGGMSMAAQNIMLFLEMQPHFKSQDTLVIFNVPEFNRIDIMTHTDHPDAVPYFPWNKTLGIGWLCEGSLGIGDRSQFRGSVQKNMGLNAIQQVNALNLMTLILYLEHRGFEYGWLCGDDFFQLNSPGWLQNFMSSRAMRQIDISPAKGLLEFGRLTHMVSADGVHPSVQGYKAIADRVLAWERSISRN